MMSFLILFLLVALPAAVWLDLTNLGEPRCGARPRPQFGDHQRARLLMAATSSAACCGAGAATQVVHNPYETFPARFRFPANAVLLELGKVISEQQQNITYRFVSDYPFKNRAPHELDDFESERAARRCATIPTRRSSTYAVAVQRQRAADRAVMMGAACVSCHNSHPESPKRDWKVGDVRGIQEVAITSRSPPTSSPSNICWPISRSRRSAACRSSACSGVRRATIHGMNRELESANEFLASLSMKISRYISPQIYKSIFSGQKDVTIHTERKKLTIFFSDIKDFTATTERLQPEQITQLLNEYFTEMSEIALAARRHHRQVHRRRDADLLRRSRDQGRAQPTREACVRMAWDMQRRLAELNAKWRNDGIEQPFRVRMGINTGYCNVGNFGSADRMDYTIIGAEANLAARLQSIAEPGGIVMSYETYALVRDMVAAHPLPPITMKGISREVVPYAVERVLDASAAKDGVVIERMAGLDIYLDPAMVDTRDTDRVRSNPQRRARRTRSASAAARRRSAYASSLLLRPANVSCITAMPPIVRQG